MEVERLRGNIEYLVTRTCYVNKKQTSHTAVIMHTKMRILPHVHTHIEMQANYSCIVKQI